MLNYLNISRWKRIINSDSKLPLYCKAKWWYNDVYEKCDCKDICKFSKYNKEDWVKYANQNYINLCIKHSLEKNRK